MATSASHGLLDDLFSLAHAETNEAKAATALDLVVEGDADGLRLLLQQWQQRSCDPSSHSLLDVNARNRITGRALLHEACAEGHLEVAKLLLEKTEADLMVRTLLGRCTPLHLAVANNHRAVVFLLLSYGADPLSRDRSGSSAMHYAKSISVAKLLIQYGGQVLDHNSKCKNAFESVLMLAKSEGADDADPVRCEFHKFLKRQAESEYKAKLGRLRQTKKEKMKANAASAKGSSGRKQQKRLSALHK